MYAELWHAFRCGRAPLWARVAATVALAALVLAGALAGVWGYGVVLGNGYVRDAHLAAGLALAGLAWCALLPLAWRGRYAGARFVRPGVLTLAVGLAATGTAILIDVLRLRGDELLIVVVLLVAGALVVLIWLPEVYRWQRGRNVLLSDGVVDVRCPECGYSLVGLRDLRCPECGAAFTIDELIRAQNYARGEWMRGAPFAAERDGRGSGEGRES